MAEDMGVDVFPGFAGKDLIFRPDGSVGGIVTNDLGVDKDGSHKPGYQPGVELLAKVTLLGEGCRGSLSQVTCPTNTLLEFSVTSVFVCMPWL